jgi:hypothetical protein
MGYPPTDYLGFTIKTKDRKVWKMNGVGYIFDTRDEAENAIKVFRLEGAEAISVEGNL